VVAALVQVLEKVTGRAEADWLGYSMGGRIALHAARVGVPVRRLLLESVTPGLRSPEERAARRSRDAAWADRFESEPVASVLDDWLAQPIFASRSDLPDAERRRQRTLRLQGHGPTLSRALRELGTGSFAPAWDLLQMWGERTHLLVGARDAKYVDIAREIVEVGSRVGMEVAAGAGHAPHMETPDAWARWVERGLGADDLPEG
jgi:2-succinyl-6-hydroxy-2,4-cyclohexadiene-1-carboxylate synthase